jgi:hypothetical protein
VEELEDRAVLSGEGVVKHGEERDEAAEERGEVSSVDWSSLLVRPTPSLNVEGSKGNGSWGGNMSSSSIHDIMINDETRGERETDADGRERRTGDKSEESSQVQHRTQHNIVVKQRQGSGETQSITRRIHYPSL